MATSTLALHEQTRRDHAADVLADEWDAAFDAVMYVAQPREEVVWLAERANWEATR